MERATQERLVGATLLIVAGVILIPWLLDGSMTDTEVSQQELVLPGGGDSGNETRRIALDVPDQDAMGGSVREIDARSVRQAEQAEPVMNLPAPAPETSRPSAEAVTDSGNPESSTEAVPARFVKPMPESADSPTESVGASVADETPEQPVAPDPVPEEPRSTASIPPAAAAVLKSPAATDSNDASVTEAGAATANAGEGVWAVQVGAFASQENAERLAERLRGKGYKAFVMRNVLEGRVRFRVRVGPVAQRSEAELLATALREDRQPARVLSHP